MFANVNYGLVKKDNDYTVLAEGYDWYLIKLRGSSVYVPKWVFENED